MKNIKLKQIIFICLSLLAIAGVGVFSVLSPITIIFSVALGLLAVLLLKNFELGLKSALIFTLFGELLRIPLGPENGLLVNDLFVPFLAGLWIIRKIVLDRNFPKSKLILPFGLFSIIAIISLLNSFRLLQSSSEILASSFYLIRFVAYFFLVFIAVDNLKSEKAIRSFLSLILKIGAGLALLGFSQMIFVPDFSEMAKNAGWDPHLGRLLSTWFDPNFMGGFFVLMLSLSFGLILYAKAKREKFWLATGVLVFLAALFLTYSRSAYIAFAFAVFVIGLLKSRQLLVMCLIAGVLLFSFSSRMQQRVTDMYYSGLSLLGVVETENPDATARLRVESWNNSINLVKNYFWTGTGYNTLRYIKLNEGYAQDTKEHSAAGFDSSLLTILTTTGIFGFLAFCWLYIQILKDCFMVWKNKELPSRLRGVGLGAFAGILSLFLVHSLFVNSLLFYPLLVFTWVIAGIIEGGERGENVHYGSTALASKKFDTDNIKK